MESQPTVPRESRFLSGTMESVGPLVGVHRIVEGRYERPAQGG